jgi:hypothetical protein
MITWRHWGLTSLKINCAASMKSVPYRYGFPHEFLATLEMRQLLAGKKLELIDFPMVPVW